jgi:hypothetical protein
VYPAFGRVKPGETASTLCQTVARRISEHPSPKSALLCFSFFPPPLGLYRSILSSLRPSVARRNSEHSSPDCGQAKERAPFGVRPGETASTLRQAVARRNSEHTSPKSALLYFSCFSPPLGLYDFFQPSAECSQAKERAPVAGLCPPTLFFLFLFFSPPLGLYDAIQPLAQCSQAKERAPFAGVEPAEAASTLRWTAPRSTEPCR